MKRFIALFAVLASGLATLAMAATPAAAAPPPSASAVEFLIIARHSGKCLNVRSASLADNADVLQRSCTGALNEQFRFVVL